MYDSEFAETLDVDEADTLEFERSWYKRRPRELRTPSPMVTPEAFAVIAAAWTAGREKTAARSAARQVSHTASKIDVLVHNRHAANRRLAKLEESIQRCKANIADSIRRREGHEKEVVAASKELDAFT